MQQPARARVYSAISHVTVAMCIIAGCGSSEDERPAAGPWRSTWEDSQRLVPVAEAIINGDEDLCGERLGTFRTELPALRPTPFEALDATLEDWISLAETIMFECTDDPAELDEQLATLGALAAEVDAGLDAGLDPSQG